MERVEQRTIVREGFQILLRAEAELLLPKEKEKICRFYERMAQTCMKWAETIYGERLRSELLAMESTRERSQFHTQRYRLTMSVPWEDERFLVLLCESNLTGQWRVPQKSYHRISHVWDLSEELLLPVSQILEVFGMRVEKKQLPFRPDGVYPYGTDMIFFRNASDKGGFLETRLSRETVKKR